MPGRKTLLIILAVLFLILPFFASLLNLYIDWQYFAETGFAEVQITTLLAKIGSGLLFGAVMLAFLLSNLVPALRSKFPRSAITIMEGTLYQLKNDELERFIKPIALTAAGILALFAGNWGAVQWEKLLLYLNSLPVGTSDPILGKDIGFYLFSLPFLELLQGFARVAALLGILLVSIVYFVNGGLTLTPNGANVAGKVRKHLALLAGIFSPHHFCRFLPGRLQAALCGKRGGLRRRIRGRNRPPAGLSHPHRNYPGGSHHPYGSHLESALAPGSVGSGHTHCRLRNRNQGLSGAVAKIQGSTQ